MGCLSASNASLVENFDETDFWWHMARNMWIEDALRETRKRADFLKVVDVGCGTGGVLMYLRNKYPLDYSMGFDGDDRLLQIARERKVPVQQMDFEMEFQFSVQPNLCLCLDVLEHVKDDARLVARIRKACAPGALLAVTVPAHPFLYSEWDEKSGHYHRYTKTGLSKLFPPSQWRILKMHHFFSFLVPVVLVRRVLFRELPDAPKIPPWLNRLLTRICSLEHRFVRLPFGTSLFCLVEAV